MIRRREKGGRCVASPSSVAKRRRSPVQTLRIPCMITFCASKGWRDSRELEKEQNERRERQPRASAETGWMAGYLHQTRPNAPGSHVNDTRPLHLSLGAERGHNLGQLRGLHSRHSHTDYKRQQIRPAPNQLAARTRLLMKCSLFPSSPPSMKVCGRKTKVSEP